MSPNFFLFFIEISVFYPSPVISTGAVTSADEVTSTSSVTDAAAVARQKVAAFGRSGHFDWLSDRPVYFLSMTFLAASTMWAASIP